MNSSHMDQFYDIYDVWHIPWWQHPSIKIMFVVLCVMVIAALVLYLVMKYFFRKKHLPAWQEALQDLERLGTAQMLNEREAKVFYTQITFILKRYINLHYGFDIKGKTDREILMFLDDQIIFPRDLIVVFQDILEHASHIKFANCPGIVDQMQQDLALSVRLVKESMPKRST